MPAGRSGPGVAILTQRPCCCRPLSRRPGRGGAGRRQRGQRL